MGKTRHVDHVHQVGPVEDTHEADVLERVHMGYTSPKNKKINHFQFQWWSKYGKYLPVDHPGDGRLDDAHVDRIDDLIKIASTTIYEDQILAVSSLSDF